MATILDRLVVILGLDSSEFDAKRKKVDSGLKDTGKGAKDTGDKFKKLGSDGAQGFDNVAKSATKFLALIGGTFAVKRFVEQTIESNAALDRLSKNLQVSATSISAWSNAAELAGGSAGGLQETMRMFSKAQTDIKLTGESSLIPFFARLGVSLADSSGRARGMNDVLLDVADSLSTWDRTDAFNFGLANGVNEETLNLLLRGRQEVARVVAQQKEFYAVTKEQAEQASKVKLAMTEAKQSFEAFGRSLLSVATPALEAVFSAFRTVFDWARENQEFIQGFLTILAVGLAAVAAAVTPINLTAVAILGLAAAIAALWQDYQTWKRGGDSLIDWSKWEPGIKAAKEGLKWIKDLLSDVAYRAIAAGDMIDAVLSRDWKRFKFAKEEFLRGTGKEYGKTEEPEPKPAPAPAAKQGADPVKNAMEYFQSQGWTKEQAAGLAANFKRESNFNAAAVGDNGKAYGIGQWHPDRQAEFQKIFGKPIQGSTLEEQLAFAQYELEHGKERAAGKRLRGAKTADEAAEIVSRYYERPADKEGEVRKRGKSAENIARKYKDTQPAQAKAAPAAKSVIYAAKGIPGASAAAQGAGAAQVAAAAAPTAAQEGSKSIETNIGEVKVYTAATDAKGIARDMKNSLDYLFASQANYGLT